MKTVMDLLKEKYPDALQRWSGWHYSIHPPFSLDDPAVVEVWLSYEDGTGAEKIVFPLEGKSDG